ncbi:MAG: tetraacyldisaccharide 4'-kinase [Sinobacteraceae bacterium]|nr:tetraacyldisaccharide 4'-kinase [Nevskiaceae bacterium]
MRALERRLNAWWYGDGVAGLLLAPFALLFAAVTRLRRSLYRLGVLRAYRASVPVVIIGNLSVGGTGKSPLVAHLATALARRGLRAGILLRGYGADVRGPRRVLADTPVQEAGDEAVMLAAATALPVVVSPARSAGARLLETQGIDLILCDDGLQHYALARDLEVVVIDAARGLGNGRLLPAGPLREGAERLASVDVVVLNGADAVQADRWAWRGREATIGMQLVPQAPRGVGQGSRWQSLERFVGQPVHAVAGIGHPERFFATLRAAGLTVVEHAFGDHHAYSAADFAFDDQLPILMTTKDAVKCRSFADERFWELPVGVRLVPDEGRDLLDRIDALCRRKG